MNIDIFGRSGSKRRGGGGTIGPPGPTGPPGPPGRGGLEDVIRWFPPLALREFRRVEQYCLLIESRNDYVYDKTSSSYTSWLSRKSGNGRKKAKGIHPCRDLISMGDVINPDRQTLVFADKNAYLIDDLIISPSVQNSYCSVFCSYMLLDNRTTIDDKTQQFIFSDNYEGILDGDPFRGLSVTSKTIRIWGARNSTSSPEKYLELPFDNKRESWTTISVQWSLGVKDNLGSYRILNNNNESHTAVIEGTFHCTLPRVVATEDVVIGGLLDPVTRQVINGFNGCIGNLEFYVDNNNRSRRGGGGGGGGTIIMLPKSIIELVMNTILIKKKKGPLPPKKKTEEEEEEEEGRRNKEVVTTTTTIL